MRLAAATIGTIAVLLAMVPAAAMAQSAVPEAQVFVIRAGDRWTAEYRFSRSAPAWLFLRSALAREDRKPWRPRSFTVETPGVRIERHGRHDLLVASRGMVPRRVRIRFVPSTLDLEAEYDPALKFSGGTVALFSDQFKVTQLASAKAADALPLDLGASGLKPGLTRISYRDRDGKVLQAGLRKAVAVTGAEQTYVLFGPARIVDAPDIAAIVDPALPPWLKGELASGTPRLLSYYARMLGARTGAKPMLMASWAGPTSGVTSMGGSVLPGLVMMAFEGSGLSARSEGALDYIRWFIAHEAAHFWLGEAVSYDRSSHAWMTEGGAELLAIRAMADLNPGYDPRGRLNESIAKCIRLAPGKPINSAEERSEQDAYYACGLVFALIAEGGAKRASAATGFGPFWRGLIERNRADREVSQEEWLAALGDPALAGAIRRMAERGEADPAAAIASMFRQSGVAFERDAAGIRVL